LGTSYATSYGKTYIAAYTIGVNLWFLGAFIADGYGSAGNIISGKLWGEKNTKALKILNKQLMKYSFVLGIVMLTLGLLFYTQIGLFFTTDKIVLQHFYSTFCIILLMQPIAACAFLLDGTFKGMGQMAFLRNVLLVATFVGFVPTLLLLDYFNLKLHAIWAAFVVWLLLRGGILFYRFKRLI
jgi:multidrug resistance protein, MATE family